MATLPVFRDATIGTEQKTHGEITTVLGISVEATRQPSSRAMRRLRTLLDEAAVS